MNLKMETTQCVLYRLGMIILHKYAVNSSQFKLFNMIGFHKKSTVIFKHFGFDKNYIGYFSLNKFQNLFSCLELFRDNHDNHFSDIH